MATTQQNTKACTWGYGALRRTGGRLTTDMIDGGGIGPDNAIARPGDHFVQRVSLYRNVLTLDPITPPDLPPQTWRRVSAAPRASVFPRRCPPPPGALGG